MIDDKKIEEAFLRFWETETEYPGNMKAQNLESYKAGYLAAMEEMKAKVSRGHCVECGFLENLINGECQLCSQGRGEDE